MSSPRPSRPPDGQPVVKVRRKRPSETWVTYNRVRRLVLSPWPDVDAALRGAIRRGLIEVVLYQPHVTDRNWANDVVAVGVALADERRLFLKVGRRKDWLDRFRQTIKASEVQHVLEQDTSAIPIPVAGVDF